MVKRVRPVRMLSVSRFSCIEHADVEFRNLTLLTGPQGSGKSLLCKLLYFCQRPIEQMFLAADDGLTVSQFRDRLGSEFLEWFPPKAWGGNRFSIAYRSDDLEVRIKRSSGRGGVKDIVSVELSDEFEDYYAKYSSAIRKQRQSATLRRRGGVLYPSYFYGIQRTFQRQLGARYGLSYPASQTYIPAGRAFFTTVGKAVAAFEQSRMFDPITAAFGKMYIALREHLPYGFHAYASVRRKKMERVFGGSLRMARDDMFVQTDDGREIPLNALSSGQQELLPLWLALEQFDGPMQWNEPTTGTNLLYIEEPEAHLFPDAQATLLEILAEIVKRKSSRSQIIITTHSPYFLSKANNLIKAGSLGFRKREARQNAVSAIVPKELWLLKDDVSAYAIQDGTTVTLIEDDELISSRYIDKISENILDEFEKLLDIVYGTSK